MYGLHLVRLGSGRTMKNLDPPDDFDETILESFEEIERRAQITP